jgi:hypothetical protein
MHGVGLDLLVDATLVIVIVVEQDLNMSNRATYKMHVTHHYNLSIKSVLLLDSSAY